jgi:hypothetical protein
MRSCLTRNLGFASDDRRPLTRNSSDDVEVGNALSDGFDDLPTLLLEQ